MKYTTFLALIGAVSAIQIQEAADIDAGHAGWDAEALFQNEVDGWDPETLIGGEADDFDEQELVGLDEGKHECDISKMYVAIFNGEDCQKKDKDKKASKEANKWLKRRSYEFDNKCHAHNKKSESVWYKCRAKKLVLKHWSGTTTCTGSPDEKKVHVFGKCYNEGGQSVRVWYKGRNQKKSNYRGRTQ